MNHSSDTVDGAVTGYTLAVEFFNGPLQALIRLPGRYMVWKREW